jgi:hypothetical protein
VPFSYWRKRKNVPRKPASVDASSIRQLKQNLSNYFHKMQGRGENCKVDCYHRNDLDYFFAYPEDYAQASVEWVGKEFKRRPHHPAFEIIFVYSQGEGTLDIYLSGDRKPVPDLQAIFADAILKAELGPDEKDERVYDLNPLRSRQFQFVYGLEAGIAEVAVKKLRLTVYGKKEHIVLAGQNVPLVHVLTLNTRGLKADKDALLKLMDGDTRQPPAGVGSVMWRKQTAKAAANARHNRPGGSRDKRRQIREIWATAKYSSRDLSAEQEYAALGMSFSAARKALRNAPKPVRSIG